ncbi:hypothetical protein YB2330_003142 [Saitoella coloradoensis]
MAGFTLPALPAVGAAWGPPSDPQGELLSQYHDVPFAPFSKGDKLGRTADWTQEAGKEGARGDQGKQRGAFGRFRDQYQAYGAGVTSQFAYQHGEDEASFSVVENRASTKTRLGGRSGGYATRGNRGGRGAAQQRGGRGGGFSRIGGRGQQQDNRRGGAQAGRGGRRFGWKDWDKPQRIRDASVTPTSEWTMLEEIEFNRLAKLSLEAMEGEDVETYGSVNYYDKTFDKITTKNSAPLQVIERVRYNPTTSVDPVVQQLANEGKANVFATDSIISMLMCAPRSVYPWDIVLVKEGDNLYLDKREGGPFDFVSVNENAVEPPMEATDGKETINTPASLSLEATYINHNLAQQTIKEEEQYKFDKENPFYSAEDETEPLASCAYRYRKFNLNVSEDEDPINLIIRTEVDAVQKTPSGEDQFVMIKALNEFDRQGASGGIDWRSKLDSQRGAVVATEMKNNSLKLARWAVQSILAGVEQMKIGYVSRATPRDAQRHVILGVAGYKPRDIASQMNLNLDNGWGIVRTIIDLCLRMEDGKYVLVKDPNKNVLRLYEVPMSTFEEGEEGEDEEDAQVVQA